MGADESDDAMTDSAVTMIHHGISILGSVANLLKRVGLRANVVTTPRELPKPRTGEVLLPGVYALALGMTGLLERGLSEVVVTIAARSTPLLGICLGMQLLTGGSTEGTLSGLNLIEGRCERLRVGGQSSKVPHLGWNRVTPVRPHALVDFSDVPRRFYFVHSFHVFCDDEPDPRAVTYYGAKVGAVIYSRNVQGAHSHPEKSHHFGMRFLSAFTRWTP